MQRRYVLAGLAIVAALALAMPATGAESALSLAKRALSSAKKAEKTGRIANGRAVRAINSIRRGVPRANRVDSVRPFRQQISATLGADVTAARAAAPAVHLFSAGPAEVFAKCFRRTTSPTTYVEAYVRTTAAGSLATSSSGLSLDGNPTYLDPTTAEPSRRVFSTTTPDNSAGSAAATHLSVTGPGGPSYEAELSRFVKAGTPPAGNGAYGAGNICVVSGNVIG